MKIVVLDGYTLNPGDLSWDGFKLYGDLVVYDRTEVEDIVARIGNSEVVFTNKTGLTKEILLACPSVKFIGVLATGYNVVDIVAARDLGIEVCNIPTYGTDAVAQYVFALLLAICHRVELHSQTVFNGEWSESKDFCYWRSPLIELAGKTMGVVGYGRIGKRTAEIAQAFGMRVIVYDHHANKKVETEIETDTGKLKFVDLEEVYQHSDVISLHVPLNDKTKGMICKASIEKMKAGVFIINTSRGPLIDEADLVESLKSGKVGAAAIDVVSTEPIKPDNVLLSAPNLIITPHIAWAPKASRARLMAIAVENLKGFVEGKLQNVVN